MGVLGFSGKPQRPKGRKDHPPHPTTAAPQPQRSSGSSVYIIPHDKKNFWFFKTKLKTTELEPKF